MIILSVLRDVGLKELIILGISAPDTPFGRVEIVGSVAKVFGKPERYVAIGEHDNPLWCLEGEALVPQIGQGLLIGEFYKGKSFRTE